MPYKDDKPKDTEIPPFKAGSDYALLVNLLIFFKIPNLVVVFADCSVT